MREAQVNLAIRWFAGYKLHEALPDHSSLTRIRQRWGEERFRRIFQRSVKACVDAGIAPGETVHIDATLIRANVSWDSIAEQHADTVIQANPGDRTIMPLGPTEKRFSATDPDAALATSDRRVRAEPSYKQHTAVDDFAGIVVDIVVTAGDVNEGDLIGPQIDHVGELTGRSPKTITADAGYAYAKVFSMAEQRGINAVIPPKAEPKPRTPIPLRRFKYDAKNKIVRCPVGKTLNRSTRAPHGWYYRSSLRTCRDCELRSRCLSPAVDRRTVVIADGFDALLRARRHRERWSSTERAIYKRHRWRIEGAHADAKGQHGLRRAVRRRRWNMAVQAYLVAAAMNLKRLAI
jgi:IS5 family transposase